NGVNPGACVALAKKHATWGNPIPTTTVSPSFSSRAPAAAMISVERISISVAEYPFSPQRRDMRESARLFEPVPVVGAAANIFVDVFTHSPRIARMFDIEFQM